MYLELHYCRCCCHWCCNSYRFYCLCACHVLYHCSLHHYQHEYYKCWQAADVNVDVLCGSYCTSVHLRWGGEGSLICGAPSGFFFSLKGCFFFIRLDRRSKHRCHACTDSFTVDMSQSERFHHVYWVPKMHVVYIVIYLSHLCLYLHLRVQRRQILSYQTTGADLKRVLLSVPNLLIGTRNRILHNGQLISNSVLQSCLYLRHYSCLTLLWAIMSVH